MYKQTNTIFKTKHDTTREDDAEVIQAGQYKFVTMSNG